MVASQYFRELVSGSNAASLCGRCDSGTVEPLKFHPSRNDKQNHPDSDIPGVEPGETEDPFLELIAQIGCEVSPLRRFSSGCDGRRFRNATLQEQQLDGGYRERQIAEDSEQLGNAVCSQLSPANDSLTRQQGAVLEQFAFTSLLQNFLRLCLRDVTHQEHHISRLAECD